MASPGNQHCANCIGTLSFPAVCHLLIGILHASTPVDLCCRKVNHATCAVVMTVHGTTATRLFTHDSSANFNHRLVSFTCSLSIKHTIEQFDFSQFLFGYDN